jgi:hypothetical protein
VREVRTQVRFYKVKMMSMTVRLVLSMTVRLVLSMTVRLVLSMTGQHPKSRSVIVEYCCTITSDS